MDGYPDGINLNNDGINNQRSSHLPLHVGLVYNGDMNQENEGVSNPILFMDEAYCDIDYYEKEEIIDDDGSFICKEESDEESEYKEDIMNLDTGKELQNVSNDDLNLDLKIESKQEWLSSDELAYPSEKEICKILASYPKENVHYVPLHRGIKKAVIDFKKYPCDLCIKSYITKDSLNRHIRLEHIETLKRAYICDTCLKTYYLKISLLQHIKTKHLNNNGLHEGRLNLIRSTADRTLLKSQSGKRVGRNNKLNYKNARSKKTVSKPRKTGVKSSLLDKHKTGFKKSKMKNRVREKLKIKQNGIFSIQAKKSTIKSSSHNDEHLKTSNKLLSVEKLGFKRNFNNDMFTKSPSRQILSNLNLNNSKSEIEKSTAKNNLKSAEAQLKLHCNRILTVRLCKLDISLHKKLSYLPKKSIESTNYNNNSPNPHAKIKNSKHGAYAEVKLKSPSKSTQTEDISESSERFLQISPSKSVNNSLLRYFSLGNVTTPLQDKDVLKLLLPVKPAESPSCFCELCGKNFQTKSYIKRHIKLVHNNERKYVCTYNCMYKAKSQGDLNRHISIIHLKEKKFKCGLCNKMFTSKACLSYHLDHKHKTREIRNYHCNMCSKAFMFHAGLLGHIASVHTNIRTYLCDVCKKVFKYKSHMAEHFKNVHLNYKHVCKECRKEFATVSSLSVHINAVHKNIRNYLCIICNGRFRNKSSLDSHVSCIHSDARKHACTQCDKTFKIKTNLLQHLRFVHKKVRNHVCDICSKEFSLITNLKVHLKVHSEIRDYACPLCTKIFRLKRRLENHLLRIHKKKINLQF